MGRRQREKILIGEPHFRLLRQFGKNPVQKKADEEMREKLWHMCCQGGRVPYVPHGEVITAWKRFIAGESHYSGIAINGDVDPGYVSLAITFERRVVAAHTTKTPALIKRLLKIHSQTFESPEEFLEAMEKVCKRTVNRDTPEEQDAS